MRKISSVILFMVACATQALSQSYPVQINTALTPPYSAFLTDYSVPGSQRFAATFLLKDLTATEYKGKLRLTIEGVGITIRTKQNFVPINPITLYGGEALTLFGEDLTEYFNPNNLDFAGISRNQYEKGAKLPEGVYRFTVEMLDYNRGSLVSNKGTAVAWIILNDPPLLNLPKTDSKVKIIDPTNIAFTWTPRHTGSPNSAFTTEYIFKLVEIWPITRNPYDAMLSQQPLYEITTDYTQIAYGLAEPALIAGRKYAWQVQAKDVDGRDLFKNQGKSEVYVFQFGDALGIPDNLSLQTANPSSLIVRWEQPIAGTDAVTYRVRYRPHNNRSHDEWYETTTQDQWGTLSSLQPNTDYEVQVRAEQSTQTSDYSTVKVFKTAIIGANDFVCKSDVSPPTAPANATPARQLMFNDTIHAAGFDVLVREITANEGGTYTGTGMMIVPWFKLAKVSMTFKNISVNEQHWLTGGEIKSVWNADSKFLLKSEKKVDSTNAPAVGNVPVTIAATETLIEITGAAIATVTKDDDGVITVYTTDGEQKTLEKGKSYSIVDEVGNGYVVDKAGNITKTTATEARKAAERGDRNYTIALTFNKGNGKFGFDDKLSVDKDKYAALSSYYQQLEGGQYIPWKAVTSSATDPVAATLEGTGIDTKKIRFEVNGSPITAINNGNNYTLDLRGGAEGVVEELLALYAPTDTSKNDVLGKLNLVSYDKVSRNVVIVPVNMEKVPSTISVSTVTNTLNKIYMQAVADWRVSMADNIKVDFDNKFDDGESGLLTNYTSDMKKVISANGTLQDNTYYLFLINDPKSGPDALGYMPRSKQAGFIFVDNHTKNGKTIDPSNTIAHELGHGAFNLQHTFKEFSALTQGSTDNIMDYTNGIGDKLYKYQWDHIHDPQRVIGLFEGDEESESQYVNELPDIFLNPDKETFTFITYSGQYLSLPKRVKNVLFHFGMTSLEGTVKEVTGVIQGFELDNKKYSVSFTGGVKYTNGSETYKNPVPIGGNEGSIIMAMPGGASLKIYKFQATGLARYNPDATTGIVDEASFPVIPFNAEFPVVKVDGKDVSKELPAGKSDCQYCYDELVEKTVKGHTDRAEILYVSKIAQIRKSYPELFGGFTSTGEDWAKPDKALTGVTEYTSGELVPYGIWGTKVEAEKTRLEGLYANETTRHLYFKEMLADLIVFIQKAAEDQKKFFENFDENSTPEIVAMNLSYISDYDILQIDIPTKIKILNALSKNSIPEGLENAILRVIRNVRQDQQGDLVLQMDNGLLFKKLEADMNDAMGKPNYTAYADLMIQYSFKVPLKEKEDVAKRELVFNYMNRNNESRYTRFFPDFHNDDVTFGYETHLPSYRDSETNALYIDGIIDKAPGAYDGSVTIGYNDHLHLNLLDDFSMNGVPVLKRSDFPKGITLTGLQFSLLLGKRIHSAETKFTTVSMTIPIIPLAIGEVGVATGWRLLLAVVDIQVIIHQFITTSDKYNQYYTNHVAARPYLNAWARFNQIYGVARITQVAGETIYTRFQTVKNEATILKNETTVPNNVKQELQVEKVAVVEDAAVVVSNEGSLANKIDNLGLTTLKSELNLLDETTKTRFLSEFAEASDDALKAMNSNTSLLSYWKTNGDFIKNKTYPNVGYKVWEDTKNAIITKADPAETKVLNAVEAQFNVKPLTNNQPVMAGAYCNEIGGNVVVKYNLSPAEKASFNYNNLDPIIKEHIDYLNFIRQDALNNGNLYEKLYSGVSKDKLIAAGDAASHAEILALDEVVKSMRAAGKFNSRGDLSKIQILVKGKAEWGNMCRCPHCFQLSNGVKMIGNE